jgi:hypothetical protein
LISLFFLSLLVNVHAQQQPERNKLRIVDTLTKQERNNRNPVILKAELDSLIQLYIAKLPPVKPQEPVREVITKIPSWVIGAGIAVLVLITVLLWLLFRYHKRLTRTVVDLKRLIQNVEFYSAASVNGNTTAGTKNKTVLEKKISDLSAELDKQKKAHQFTLQEYESVRKAIAEVYKVKNYPYYDKAKEEGQMIKDLLITERIVALHAFEKFMKPIVQITDANKNNPAKISVDDSERLLELLVSLSLYYIEYLYLRINDLSIGGNMVQRIGSNGKGIDPALLKKLNTEHGSRALALRMALNKSGINKLSYPVFDETDLNNF